MYWKLSHHRNPIILFIPNLLKYLSRRFLLWSPKMKKILPFYCYLIACLQFWIEHLFANKRFVSSPKKIVWFITAKCKQKLTWGFYKNTIHTHICLLVFVLHKFFYKTWLYYSMHICLNVMCLMCSSNFRLGIPPVVALLSAASDSCAAMDFMCSPCHTDPVCVTSLANRNKLSL